VIFLLRSFFRSVCFVLLGLLILLSVVWTFGALWFDCPLAIRHEFACIYLLAVCLALLLVKSRLAACLGVLMVSAMIALWWRSLAPSNGRDWQTEVSREPWAEVKGDFVTIHNVRDFDYRSESDFIPRWETRTVRLSQLTGMDLAINYWGSPWMAHPIVSFQFAKNSDTSPLAMSIETRREKGESYSALGGFYRQFELVYIVAEERDVIGVRTNYRKGEDVYLYRTTTTPKEARERFLEYVNSMNLLHEHPRWYNAITTNCTTSIRSQRSAASRAPLDWRILINGKMDEWLYQGGFFERGGLPFGELKKKALINPAAQAADQDPDFSRNIRAGRPGFGAP
jgi:hypothetical protein